jgi:hypothetical protein
MKKRYNSPKTVTVKIETANMIAVSGTLDGTQSIKSSDDFGSRRSGWEDDDYE